MKVFKNNEFFAGLSIPEPDVRESLELKMPRDFSADGMDFLKVPIFGLISVVPIRLQFMSDVLIWFRNAWIKIRPRGTLASSCCDTLTSPISISAYLTPNWKNMNDSEDCALVQR
jgi:hypothetical protein